MLILQRKEGESLLIGEDVEITVMAVEAGPPSRREEGGCFWPGAG